jgi:4-hydroxyphenylacetate 3-monooxygenase/4-hydroxybutyryl-CoA dehydratase/vinylacetyl-CoA-Delta-isomerase
MYIMGKSFQTYKDSLLAMRPNIYVGGELIGRDDPRVHAGMEMIRVSYDAEEDPEYKDLINIKSSVTGNDISLYTHLPQSKEDLMARQKLTRALCGKCGGCFQRCMANDSINAISIVTKEMDDDLGTDYHDRFLSYIKTYQDKNICGNAAQTDIKGDRSKRPHEQDDPDVYVRIVERRKDGIIVSGAKAHNTIAPYAQEILVMPTRAMVEKDADWAVSFAVPADAEGVSLLCRATQPRPRNHIKAPFNEKGMMDSLTVFDNVFVPWERVFMCGEWKYAGRLALLFANYHRFSYCGCKPAVTDVVIGATALVAEYNGVGKASHIRDDLAELMVTAELVYAAGVAAADTGVKTSSGTFEPNFMYSNAGRYHAGVNIMHEYDILMATAGGWPATMPYEEDFFNKDTKGFLDKYSMRKPGVSAELQHRLFRFISDFSCSAWSGLWQYAGIHGGGSPIMELIGIRSNYDLEAKTKLVKYLAGIKN